MSVGKKCVKEWKEMLVQAGLISLFFILLELLFHFMEGLEVSGRIWYPILFSIPLGFLVTAIASFFPKPVNQILSTIVMVLVTVWFCVQLCHSGVFRTYMEFSKVFSGADVAESFGNEMKDAIIGKLPKILLFVVLAAGFSFLLFWKVRPEKKSVLSCGIGLLAGILLQGVCYATLFVEGQGAYSPISMYQQYPPILDNNIQNFGVIVSLRLDLKGMFADEEVAEGEDIFAENDMSLLLGEIIPNETPTPVLPSPAEPSYTVTPKPTQQPEAVQNPETTQQPENIPTEEPQMTETPTAMPTITPTPEVQKTTNTLDIDFEALLAAEENNTIKSVHRYVSAQSGSHKNAYTGYFEGYNLIMICAESFTSYLINEELTPTLYKMSTEGFVFENFYGTFKAVTTNGEYAFCTGLMPNTVGKNDDLKKNSTFLLSADKYLPYAMGNVFQSLGADTFAYHGNDGNYYERRLTHPNMGYHLCRFWKESYVDGVYSSENPLVYTTLRPNSDEETAQQTVADYLNNKDENGKVKPFHAYYMTYSGHHPYYAYNDEEHVKSPMVFENREVVDPLDCSEEVKSYIAANLELENMLTVLLESLKEAGCLENTVIVLTGDHYPYGLTDRQFKELVELNGYSLEADYGMYENSFICYNAGMKEPVTVTAPCCTVDIVPTLLNLFGVEYDSRLLAGTDVLDPNSFHVAMLYNQSFITDKIKYNTANGKVKYIADKDTVPQAYIDACINYVKNKFEISLQIISNDYYRIIYDSLETKNK
ncbi:MAG: sulfatase-like hydrolase/transferase [Lachnospiraceae bacterium]|nr:sulfatase-like hydrolase/transferase [Lachnospiraceae bacterium]